MTASRISINLHVMQELNSVNIVYCSFTLARIRANQITKNITKSYTTSVFSLSLPVGQISYWNRSGHLSYHECLMMQYSQHWREVQLIPNKKVITNSTIKVVLIVACALFCWIKYDELQSRQVKHTPYYSIN